MKVLASAVLEWLFFHVVFLLEWVSIERYGSKDLWFRLPPIYSLQCETLSSKFDQLNTWPTEV